MDEYLTRQTLIDCGAGPKCKGLGEMLDWLIQHVQHGYPPGIHLAHGEWEGPCPEMTRDTHVLTSPPDQCRFLLSSVVAALEKDRPRFGGIDALEWLLAHDVRARKYVTHYDPKELKVGDKFDHTTPILLHYGDFQHSFDNGTWAVQRTEAKFDSYGVIFVMAAGAPGAGWWSMRAKNLRGHITRVSRPDPSGKMVQIWPPMPKPEPKFKPGDVVECRFMVGDRVVCVGTGGAVIDSKPGYVKIAWNWCPHRTPEEAEWLSETTLELAPAPDFQPAEVLRSILFEYGCSDGGSREMAAIICAQYDLTRKERGKA